MLMTLGGVRRIGQKVAALIQSVVNEIDVVRLQITFRDRPKSSLAGLCDR